MTYPIYPPRHAECLKSCGFHAPPMGEVAVLGRLVEAGLNFFVYSMGRDSVFVPRNERRLVCKELPFCSS